MKIKPKAKNRRLKIQARFKKGGLI